MARQNMQPVPYLKNMEAYNDFSGGLNTVTSDDNLKDNECKDLTNVDLSERGPLSRRGGMVRYLSNTVSGTPQGYFRYFKTDGTTEEILAIEGKLYKGGAELPVVGLVSFQTNRPIEAVQYKDKLYIATGTKLVVYDGTTASVITPYQPEAMEVLYIGTNALADNPDQFISDSTSAYVQITGVTADMRYGVVNKGTTFTAYIAKPVDATVEYKWSYRKLGAADWIPWPAHPDFTADQKTFGFVVGAGDYEIQCLARKQGDTDITLQAEYQIPKYTVTETDQNKTEDTSHIQECNRILVHWQRIILYGDPDNKDLIYISDLDRPEYFPTLNTLRFENDEQEGLTSIVKFRDMLVAFTPHTIQGLYGKSPEDYQRTPLSTSIGCVAPYSAQVFENYIGFLSHEGLYILKSLGYTDTRVNVQKIDAAISNIVPRDTDANAIVADGQYQITYPSRNLRLRFYYQRGVWTKDESVKLDFLRSYESSGVVYGLSAVTGNVLKMDPDVFDDDGYVYTDSYVFKEYDFKAPYNPKKLKEMQVLLAQTNRVQLSFYVYADGAAIVNPDASYPSVNTTGEVVWNDVSTPNILVEAGTVLGSWIMGQSYFGNIESGIQKLALSGKCRKVRVEISHTEAVKNTVLGLGFIYKLRKP